MDILGTVAGGGDDDGVGQGDGRGDSFTPSGSFWEERTGCFMCALREVCFTFFPNSS